MNVCHRFAKHRCEAVVASRIGDDKYESIAFAE